MSEQLIDALSGELSKYGVTATPKDGLAVYLQSLRQGIVSYEIQTSWVWIWTAVAFGVVAILALILAIVKSRDWDEASWGVGICAIIVILVCIIIIAVQAHDIATCYSFPDKVVYDHIRQMLRQFLSNS